MAFPRIWLTPDATVSLQESDSSVIKTHRLVTLRSRSSGRLPRFLLLNDRLLVSDSVPGNLNGRPTLWCATTQPKAGHIANQEAKVCADAISRILSGGSPDPAPVTNSACYSTITMSQASWLHALFQYDPGTADMKAVAAASGALNRLGCGELRGYGNLVQCLDGRFIWLTSLPRPLGKYVPLWHQSLVWNQSRCPDNRD